MLEDADPSSHLITQFLAEGPWNSGQLSLNALSLQFRYAVDGGILNLSCDSGTISQKSTNQIIEGIIVNANYHLDLDGRDRVQEAVDAISQFGNRCDHFMAVAKQIFGAEE